MVFSFFMVAILIMYNFLTRIPKIFPKLMDFFYYVKHFFHRYLILFPISKIFIIFVYNIIMLVDSITYTLETIDGVANRLLTMIEKGDIILLSGDPGVGKSTLIYSLIKAVESEKFLTQSPTFAKVNEYPQVIHMDWYHGDNICLYQDYLNADKLIFIEWGLSLMDDIQWNYHWHLEKIDDGSRKITIYKNNSIPDKSQPIQDKH